MFGAGILAVQLFELDIGTGRRWAFMAFPLVVLQYSAIFGSLRELAYQRLALRYRMKIETRKRIRKSPRRSRGLRKNYARLGKRTTLSSGGSSTGTD
jgi:hypothetical protein